MDTTQRAIVAAVATNHRYTIPAINGDGHGNQAICPTGG